MTRQEAAKLDTDYYVQFIPGKRFWGVFGNVTNYCYLYMSTQQAAEEAVARSRAAAK